MPSIDTSDADPGRRERRERERDRAHAAATRIQAHERVSMSVPRDTHYLALVRRVVADCAGRAGFQGEDLDKIELAVDEACSNAIIYQTQKTGTDQLDVEISIEKPRFTVQLRDRGEPYPFESQGNFDLEDHLRRMEPGGLGIYIIKNFMDDVVYEHSAREGNMLTMTKYLTR